MTVDTLPLCDIRPSRTNPRRDMDAQGIEGLAASIKADGLLQNLVVTPLKGRHAKMRYGLISGHRRFAALTLLQKRGDLSEDYQVPVTIRTTLSAKEKLRIATVENVQRENLSPLDEADAFANLLKNGTPIDDLAAETGLSPTTIKRRLALTGLCDEAQTALQAGMVTLAQAEALTLGRADAQRDILERLKQGYSNRPEDIKDHLLDDRLPVSLAIFPRELYTGTVTSDLFAENDRSYFDDTEQFWNLQRQAVDVLAEHHRETAAWVEVTEDYSLRRWQYDEAETGDEWGVVINLSPTGGVDVAKRLVKRLSSSLGATLGDHPIAPKPRPAYSTPLCRYIAHHKSLAVQAVLLSHPRKAKEVAVIMMMGGTDGWDRPITLTPHAGLNMAADAPQAPASFEALEAQIQPLAAQVAPSAEDADTPIWKRFFSSYQRDNLTLYEAVCNLSDDDLDTLHLLLPVLCFGQSNCEELDQTESLFNRVAQDLQVDMRQWWRPDAGYLGRRTKAQLIDIATESGAAEKLGPVAKYTKAELVTALTAAFQDNTNVAHNWLPGVMHFPAVEPDNPDAVSPASGQAEAA